MCLDFLRFSPLRVFSIYAESNFFKDNQKLIRPVFNPPFDCWKYCPLKKPGIVESENSFLHSFFRIRRIRWNYLNVYGEYGEFRVVCGTQTYLQIHGKNLYAHGEDAKRHNSEDISVNDGKTWNFLVDPYFLSVQDGWIKPKNHITTVGAQYYVRIMVVCYMAMGSAYPRLSM